MELTLYYTNILFSQSYEKYKSITKSITKSTFKKSGAKSLTFYNFVKKVEDLAQAFHKLSGNFVKKVEDLAQPFHKLSGNFVKKR
jgi:hypothetical protein